MTHSAAMTAPAGNEAAAPKRAYTRIDWKQAAALIAGGRTVAEAAAALGLAPERIWRHLNRSLRFRFYIRQAVARQHLLAELHLAVAGREAVLARSRDAASLDAAGLQWLAAESGLAGNAGRRAAERRSDGEDLVQQLAATGNRPPSQALRRKLAAGKADMDRFMAAARVELAATEAMYPAGEREEAAAAAAPMPAPAPSVAIGAQRAETVANGHLRAETAANGAQRSKTGGSGHPRSATDGEIAGRNVEPAPKEQAPKEPAPKDWDYSVPRPYRSGAIVDLPPSSEADEADGGDVATPPILDADR